MESISWITAVFLGNTFCYPLDSIKTKLQCNINQYNIKELFQGYRYFLPNILIARYFTFKSFVTLTNYYNTMFVVFIISVISSLISTPFEMLKIQKQINSSINQIKFNILFRNYHWTFIRDLTSTGFYFPVYYYLKNNYSNKTYVNGFIAGCMSKLISYPFDTIKTNQQIGKTIREIGYRNLYRGITYETLRTGISSLIIFSSYEYFSHKLKYIKSN